MSLRRTPREINSPGETKTTAAPLAQLAEQLTLNQWVPGSSPGGCTRRKAAPTPMKIGVGAAFSCLRGVQTAGWEIQRQCLPTGRVCPGRVCPVRATGGGGRAVPGQLMPRPGRRRRPAGRRPAPRWPAPPVPALPGPLRPWERSSEGWRRRAAAERKRGASGPGTQGLRVWPARPLPAAHWRRPLWPRPAGRPAPVPVPRERERPGREPAQREQWWGRVPGWQLP